MDIPTIANSVWTAIQPLLPLLAAKGVEKLGEEAVGRLTVSGGLAGFPWDGRTPGELLARADANAMRSKQQGKNAICFGPGAAPSGNAT